MRTFPDSGRHAAALWHLYGTNVAKVTTCASPVIGLLQLAESPKDYTQRGRWLEDLARAKGWRSEVSAALAFEVSRATVARWYQGSNIRKRAHRRRLCAALGITEDQLDNGPWSAQDAPGRPNVPIAAIVPTADLHEWVELSVDLSDVVRKVLAREELHTNAGIITMHDALAAAAVIFGLRGYEAISRWIYQEAKALRNRHLPVRPNPGKTPKTP